MRRHTSFARLTGVLRCLSELQTVVKDASFPGGVTELLTPSPSRVDLCSQDAGHKFCLVHTGLDPLPLSASFGFCLPDACTNVEITDALSALCALPSCSLLDPLDVFSYNVAELCGTAQKALCGPDDRTMMQHDISFTCVQQPSSPSRRLSAEGWLDAVDNEYETLVSQMDLDELVSSLEHVISRFVDYLELELKDLVQSLGKDFRSEFADVSDVVRSLVNGTRSDVRDKVQDAVRNLRDRVNERTSQVRGLVRKIEDKVRDSVEAERLKHALDKSEESLTKIAQSHLQDAKESLKSLSDVLKQWLHRHDHHGGDLTLSPLADWFRDQLKHLDDSINDLQWKPLDREWRERLAQLRSQLRKMEDLMVADVQAVTEQCERFIEEVQKKIKEVDEALHGKGHVSTTAKPEVNAASPALMTTTGQNGGSEDGAKKAKTQGKIPRVVEELTHALNVLSEDVVRIVAKDFLDLTGEEIIRRDIKKIDKLFSRLAGEVTEQELVDWAHLKEEVNAYIEEMTAGIAELRDRVRSDIDEAIRRDKDFADSIIRDISEGFESFQDFWNEHWKEIMNNTRVETDELAKKIDEVRSVLEDLVTKQVTDITNGIKSAEDDLVLKLKSLTQDLKSELEKLIDDLKKEIANHGMRASTTTTTTTTPSRQVISTQTMSTHATNDGGDVLHRLLSNDDVDDIVVGPDSLTPDDVRSLFLTLASQFHFINHNLDSFLANAAFIQEMLRHISPKFQLRDISVNEPMWLSAARMKSVLKCGSGTFRNPTQVLYSGHLPQTIGDYYPCVGDETKDSPNRYCLVKGSAAIAQGRCVPRDCTVHDMTEMTGFLCDWLLAGRSCLELASVVPPDYCIYTSFVSCGLLSKMPDDLEPTELIQLPAWYGNSTTLRKNSWWTSSDMGEEIRSKIASIKAARSLQLHPEVSSQHRLVKAEGAFAEYDVVCTEPGKSYWTRASVAGVSLLVLLLVVTPVLGLLFPSSSLWRTFDVRKNWRRYVKGIEKRSSLSTSCVNGMRVLSICWIIWGHTFASVILTNLLENFDEAIDLVRSFSIQGVVSAVFAVDSFFAFSGFLVGFRSSAARSDQPPRAGDGSVLGRVAYGTYKRYTRLSPVYFFVLAVFILVLPDLISAPLYPTLSHYIWNGQPGPDGVYKGGCKRTWWLHLLYLDNLFPSDTMDNCMGWSWYLANDFQLTIVGLLITALYATNAYTHFAWFVVVMASVVTAVQEVSGHHSLGYFSLSMNPDALSIQEDIGEAMDHQLLYIRPWPRAIAYVMALCSGVYLARVEATLNKRSPLATQSFTQENNAATPEILLKQHEEALLLSAKREEKASATTSAPLPWPLDLIRRHYLLGSALSLSTMALCLWLPWIRLTYLKHWPYPLTVLYNVYSRAVWTACLLFFVALFFLSYHRRLPNAPLVNSLNAFLSAPFFSALAPLVYTTYLAHMLIQEIYYSALPSTAYITLLESIHQTLAWIPLSFLLALLLYLSVELPFSLLL